MAISLKGIMGGMHLPVTFGPGVTGKGPAAKNEPPPANKQEPDQGAYRAAWGTQNPSYLAPAHSDPIGSEGVLGDGNSQWSSYFPNGGFDYKNAPMHWPVAPTQAQFPQAMYNSFDQLHNWPDASGPLTLHANFPFMRTVVT